MDQELVVVQGQVFDVIGVNELVIAELNKQYLPLKINGIDDKEGYRTAHEGLMKYVKARTMVEKHGKATREKAIKYQKDVIAEEKRVIGLLAPGEDHLRAERQTIDDIEARIKAEAEAKEAARIRIRVDTICASGATFNGQMYAAFGLQIPSALVKACTDEEFARFVAQMYAAKDAEDARLKAEEDARKAESDRLAKVAAEQEAERQRLAEIALKQTEEGERIKAGIEAIAQAKQKLFDDEEKRRKAIEDEEKRIVLEKIRTAELAQVRKEAAERARIETEAKIKREAEEKTAAELRVKEKEEKRLSRLPDKQKLIALAKEIEIAYPCMKTEEGTLTLNQFKAEISGAILRLKEAADAL